MARIHPPALAPLLHTALALCLACAAYGQTLPLTPPPGHRSDIRWLETAGPLAMNGFAADPSRGALYVSVHNLVYLRDATGTRVAFQLPVGEQVGVMAVMPGNATLLYTSYQTRRVYLRDLVSGRTTGVAGLDNAFDVAFTARGDVLMAANPDWPKPGARPGVWLLDTAQGQHREIIQLSGASGPLVVLDNGDLLCSLAPATFPPPSGGTSLVRFTSTDVARAIQGPTPLTLAQAQTVLAQLDGASDLALDDRARIWITDAYRGGVRRTQPGTFTLEATDFVPSSALTTVTLQFVPGDAATFDAWQPTSAGQMLVWTSDWLTTAEVRELAPQRPELSAAPGNTVPPGPAALVLSGGPPSGIAWVGVSPLPRKPSEYPLFTAGGVAAWFALDFLVPPTVFALRLDATGSSRLAFTNPGSGSRSVPVQCLAVDTTGAFGTSNPLVLVLQ
ncbi:MAG: hypothetical protein H6836_07460 [Planctomycetes bacterium]|nr:hypothetical protein [Planctomycetota bacterium]MCB9889401.1 hypothetical protein [Planctomycetota bacterium]